MNILVASARFPYPLDKGDRLTVHHLVKYLSKQHRVCLVCFLEPGQDPAWRRQLEPYCARIEVIPLRRWRAYLNCLVGLLGPTPLQLNFYADPAMRTAVRRLVEEEQPDLLYSQLIRMGQYTAPYVERARVAAFNLSMTLNHRRLAEHAPGRLARAFHQLEYRKLKAFEAEFARRFDKVLYISKYDLAAAEQYGKLDNVFIVPHGVDYAYFTADPAAVKVPHSVIMTGNMNYAPNVDAVLYFHREILPRLRQELPDLKLYLVGADPTPAVRALAASGGIEVTGRVADLREWMNRAEVAVAPIRIGAGLQNKVLEGLSMGLPMVVTSVANEGIQATPGRHLLVADQPGDFARSIVELLASPGRRRELGSAAREFIIQSWSWEKHFADLEAMMIELVAARKAARVPGPERR